MRTLNEIVADINAIEAALGKPESQGKRTALKSAYRKLATEYKRALLNRYRVGLPMAADAKEQARSLLDAMA